MRTGFIGILAGSCWRSDAVVGQIADVDRSAAVEFVSAGYIVTRPVSAPELYQEAGAPAQVVSASDFVAPVLPAVPPGWLEAAESPPTRFAAYADSAQGKLLLALSADLERFGLDGEHTAPLADWLGAAWQRGDFHAPSAFRTLVAARRLLTVFGPVPRGAMIVGLAIASDDVSALAAADKGASFISRLPLCGDDPAPGGTVLGFDLYRPDGGELHAWLDTPGAVDILRAADVSLNEHGLLADATSAAAVRAQLRDAGDRR